MFTVNGLKIFDQIDNEELSSFEYIIRDARIKASGLNKGLRPVWFQDNEKIESFLESSHNIYTKQAHRTVAETTLYEFCAYIRGDDMKTATKKEATDGKDSD